MIGQGGPRASWAVRLPAAYHRRPTLRVGARAVPATAARAFCCALLAGTLVMAAHAATADDLRVRIAWGGGPSRLWSGTIAVSDGAVSEPHPLGIEADEPGSMWIESDPHGGDKLIVRQRSPRSYDGVDLLVSVDHRDHASHGAPAVPAATRKKPAADPEKGTAAAHNWKHRRHGWSGRGAWSLA